MTAGMTSADEGQRRQGVLFASCRNEGRLQEHRAGSWNSDPSWTIDLHLLTRGFWLFPQAKRTLKESFASCQPGFRGFVCEQRRKHRCFRWSRLHSWSGVRLFRLSSQQNYKHPDQRRPSSHLYRQVTGSWNYSSICLVLTDSYLQFRQQFIGSYLQYPPMENPWCSAIGQYHRNNFCLVVGFCALQTSSPLKALKPFT